MISETALGLLLTPKSRLTALARLGGLLTPATALGNELVERLRQTKLIEIECKVI